MQWQLVTNGGKALARTTEVKYPTAFTSAVFSWAQTNFQTSNNGDGQARRTACTLTSSTYYLDPSGSIQDTGAWFRHYGV